MWARATAALEGRLFRRRSSKPIRDKDGEHAVGERAQSLRGRSSAGHGRSLLPIITCKILRELQNDKWGKPKMQPTSEALPWKRVACFLRNTSRLARSQVQ